MVPRAVVTCSSGSCISSSNVIWAQWVIGNSGGSYSITTTSSNYDTATAWYDWNQIYTSSCSPTSVTITDYIPTDYVWVDWAGQQHLTAEQAAAQAAEQELRRQEQEKEYAKRLQKLLKAQATARHLLESLLRPDQAATLKDRNYFDLEITSRDGSRKRYRIHKGRSGNVELLGPDGVPIRKYCVHPHLYVPDEDTMVAQKLMLETDEERFLKTANMTELRRAA